MYLSYCCLDLYPKELLILVIVGAVTPILSQVSLASTEEQTVGDHRIECCV